MTLRSSFSQTVPVGHVKYKLITIKFGINRRCPSCTYSDGVEWYLGFSGCKELDLHIAEDSTANN